MQEDQKKVNVAHTERRVGDDIKKTETDHIIEDLGFEFYSKCM